MTIYQYTEEVVVGHQKLIDEFTLSEICNGRSEERKRFGFV